MGKRKVTQKVYGFPSKQPKIPLADPPQPSSNRKSTSSASSKSSVPEHPTFENPQSELAQNQPTAATALEQGGSQEKSAAMGDSLPSNLSTEIPVETHLASSSASVSSPQSKSDCVPSSLSHITNWKVSELPDSLKFSDNSAKELFETKFSTRKINRGRGVLFSSFPPTPVLTWVYGLHSENVMSINEVAFPTLVRLFYANLKIFDDETENPRLESFVLGKKVVLTSEKINSIFNLPNNGAKFFSFKEWNTPEFSLSDIRNFFWEGQSFSFSGGDALNNLSIEHFLLHKLLCSTILSGSVSSGGHTTDVNSMSVYLMFMITHQKPVNLGFLILKYMAYSFTCPNKNLPYSMLLTAIFKKENIFLPLAWLENPKERKIIDLTSLKKMRIHFSNEQGWYLGFKDYVRRSSRLNPPPVEAHSAPRSPFGSSSTVLESLTALHAKIDSIASHSEATSNTMLKKIRKLKTELLSTKLELKKLKKKVKASLS
ncbi:hypothetical protein CDL12_03740 [Handroanthus impetiginosus]|uniref:Putative plant transposon protein domain-containing protein n=1 Tax=Handroanthus impetiginosus TaxID=429701 RepID=A0A2G9I1P4_9LAMI|nr:hypothetical protein CDL12_03740 [Handroanthus impetiginosus]